MTNEEAITLTVWGNDGMPSDVIEGVERIVVYLLNNERSKVRTGLRDKGYTLSKGKKSKVN
tara:strand:+ start:1265 stop:1447 length:183 start_codon:yes stop_codon:yes gene_type:complete